MAPATPKSHLSETAANEGSSANPPHSSRTHSSSSSTFFVFFLCLDDRGGRPRMRSRSVGRTARAPLAPPAISACSPDWERLSGLHFLRVHCLLGAFSPHRRSRRGRPDRRSAFAWLAVTMVGVSLLQSPPRGAKRQRGIWRRRPEEKEACRHRPGPLSSARTDGMDARAVQLLPEQSTREGRMFAGRRRRREGVI